MSLADAHGWTPEQIDVMDPDFITELLIQKTARADYQLFESEIDPKQAESKRKQMIVRRKAEIVKQREKRGSKR